VRVNKLYSNQNKIEGISNLPRFIKLIRESISKLELNLDNLAVLTEAASGNYVCTPIIAAISRAKKVYVYTKNSKFGTAEQLFQNTKKLAKITGVNGKIKFINNLDGNIIKDSDIITNLGFLRPINKDFIENMKDTAVIPLMRETWEFREGEINLEACKNKGILVLGTNENHPDLKIFDYLGHLCAKKLFEMNIEILTSKILVCGGGCFGLNIIKCLVNLGASVQVICDENAQTINSIGAEKISSMNNNKLDLRIIEGTDVVIVTSYPDRKEIIGNEGLIKTKQLKEHCPGVVVIQFKGNVNRESIIREKIRIIPEVEPKYGHMSWTLNDLGPKPVIDLHTGGLKVGEIMTRLRRSGYSPPKSTEEALNNSLAQNFSPEQKKKYSYE